MSADNWAICPKCKAKREEETAGLYGKVSEAEYKKRMAEANKPDPRDFREDYEIGIDGSGKFMIDYSGHCQECGLKYSYKFTAYIMEQEK